MSSRGTVLITGVGRRRGIAAGIAVDLAQDGWDVALNHWTPYDARLGLVQGASDPEDIAVECRSFGVHADVVAGDLSDPGTPSRLIDAANARGDLRALVLSHCESVDSHTLDTSVEAWDRHFAVNARASWLLIKELTRVLPQTPTSDAVARVVALTSDHTAFNLPYGASKGALDRLVQAAGVELGPRGLRANVINPGPVDTGWMTPEWSAELTALTPPGRLGTPQDIANVIRFLLSDAGGWINAQLLKVDGGFKPAG